MGNACSARWTLRSTDPKWMVVCTCWTLLASFLLRARPTCSEFVSPSCPKGSRVVPIHMEITALSIIEYFSPFFFSFFFFFFSFFFFFFFFFSSSSFSYSFSSLSSSSLHSSSSPPSFSFSATFSRLHTLLLHDSSLRGRQSLFRLLHAQLVQRFPEPIISDALSGFTRLAGMMMMKLDLLWCECLHESEEVSE